MMNAAIEGQHAESTKRSNSFLLLKCFTRLLPRIVILAIWLLTLSSFPFPSLAQSSSMLGSSFNCANPASPSAEIVCASENLRRSDLKQMQAYYTVRHAFPARVGEYRQTYLDSLKAADELCGLANTQNRQHSVECLGRAFEEMNRRWELIITGFSDRSALEEIRISVDDKILIQRQLRSRNFLTANAAEDGIYETGMRSAISQFQRANGFPASGFLGIETARALLPSLAQSQFNTTNIQSRTPVQLPTRPSNLSDEKNNDSVTILSIAGFIVIIWLFYEIIKEKFLSKCPSCGTKGAFKITENWKEPRSSFTQKKETGRVISGDQEGRILYENTAYELGVAHTKRVCRNCGFSRKTQKNYQKVVSRTRE